MGLDRQILDHQILAVIAIINKIAHLLNNNITRNLSNVKINLYITSKNCRSPVEINLFIGRSNVDLIVSQTDLLAICGSAKLILEVEKAACKYKKKCYTESN